MRKALSHIWAKTSGESGAEWHPLILHMLDVAASANAILEREPESTRNRMAVVLGLEWGQAKAWLSLLIASHDLGKACPGFQSKWPYLLAATGLRLPRSPNLNIHHAFVSQIALVELLQEKGWPFELAELAADAVGCHHGSRASERDKDKADAEINVAARRDDRLEAIRSDWMEVRRELFHALVTILKPGDPPSKLSLSGPDFMLLSGLTSFTDWIGSNEEWFPFGNPIDCEDLAAWYQHRQVSANSALNAMGWEYRTVLCSTEKTFQQVFAFPPRPLQQAVADAVHSIQGPSILLVEAPMGEGKTEAAFYAHLELQRRFGHRGFYIALPTKATGNAMFTRTLAFLSSQGADRRLDLQLQHGGALLNDAFQNMKVSGIYDSENGGEIRAGEWFTNKKRALLSEYGVGTVDQALLPILPVRHHFVRLWGLANRVVVFDEIHAYDAYTGTLLVHLLRWLLALGSSVVLLSATLSPSIRRAVASVVGSAPPEPEAVYPRLSVFTPGEQVRQIHFEADPDRRLTLLLEGISPDLPCIRNALEGRLFDGGLALALLNTVQRAQYLYTLFPDGEPITSEGQTVGKRLLDGTEIFLFHARFPADQRQRRENNVLKTFGHRADRIGRKILIATQVAEQSLDLDFDIMITDLAPIDLVLQRAGRLWRHRQAFRPLPEPTLIIAGLAGEEPPQFGKPLWWNAVYREDILLRSWSALRADNRRHITLPDEIDEMVQSVYEELVEVPDSLRERLEKAQLNGDGEAYAHKGMANHAIIGLPEDSSWNDPSRFVLFDEDHPGVHKTLMAQTRLGEDSAIVIPLCPDDQFDVNLIPDFLQSKKWFLQAMSLSRKSIVRKLQKTGVPEGWKKSSLLRNCFPLVLDENGTWIEDASVQLNTELGLLYETKEIE
jgi:CRISPR-associated endonuclease/helicase Cas3